MRKYKAKLWYKPVKKPTAQSLKSDDETILDDTGSEPTTMEHMEEGEETIKFKEALEPESEIEEDSSEKEDSATNEETESVKGTFQFQLRIIKKRQINSFLAILFCQFLPMKKIIRITIFLIKSVKNCHI